MFCREIGRAALLLAAQQRPIELIQKA